MPKEKAPKRTKAAPAVEVEIVPPEEPKTEEPKEVEVRKDIFYDFVPRWICRTALFWFVQGLRLGTAVLVAFLLLDQFSLLLGGTEGCGWAPGVWGLSITMVRSLSTGLLVLASIHSMSVDFVVFAKENDLPTPPLLSYTAEGHLAHLLMTLHLFAFHFLSRTLGECNGPYAIPLKIASLAYLLVLATTIARIPIRLYRKYPAYFSLTKKVKVIEKKP